MNKQLVRGDLVVFESLAVLGARADPRADKTDWIRVFQTARRLRLGHPGTYDDWNTAMKGIMETSGEDEKPAQHSARNLDKAADFHRWIEDERERQIALWTEDQETHDREHDNHTWLAILTKQIGDVANIVLRESEGTRSDDDVDRQLSHVAAVCLAWFEQGQNRGAGEW